jgi:hypothetical protein
VSAPVAIDWVLRQLVREAVRDELREQLAPMRASLDALAGAGALAPVSLDAAAPVFGKSVATLRRLAAAGKLPGALRVGRSWRIDLGAVRSPTPETVSELAAEARSR